MIEFLNDRWSDLKYALRMMRKNPGFTAVATLSLALGIGANTAIFTLVDAVLLKMLPVKDPRQLYVIATNPSRPSTSWNFPDYIAFRDHNTGFSGLTAYSGVNPFGFTLQSGTDHRTEIANGVMVSGNYFETLGVDPAIGRVLNPDDDRQMGGGPYMVLSHEFWRRRFAADTGVIGKSARVNGFPFTIVGVVRPGFTGVEVGVTPEFYIPLTMRSEVTNNRNWNNRNNWWLITLGRLKPGASIPKLEAELVAISKEQEAWDRRTALNQKFVNSAAKEIKLLPGAQGYSRLRNRLSQPLWVLMAVVGAVLLIACANVANLLLARAAARQQEIAVRLAVGSGRGRLIWQLLTESTLLGVIGGLAGLLLAYLGAGVLLNLLPQSGWTPVALDVTPDLRLLGFTLGISLVTGILFGLAPALQSTRPALVPALRQEAGSTGSRAGYRLRKTLVVVQVGLSLLLMIGAGLFLRSLRNLHTLDAGFRRDHLLFVSVDPGRIGYKGQRLRDFYEQLRERVSALPGVQTATLASITPLGGSRWNDSMSFEGYQRQQGERMVVDQNAVGPGFFEMMGIPIIAGRDFRPDDNPAFSPTPPDVRRPGSEPTAEERAGPRVAVINESVAQKYFAGRSPIGMRASYGDSYKPEESFEIIGVVKDARYFGLRDKTQPMIYQAIWRSGAGSRTLCVRTSADPARLTETIRREVQALDSSVPVLNSRTIAQHIDNNLLQEKLVATLSSFFGLLALLLASVGLYGVMAHSVARRTREIGIRMALGAERGKVLWLVLRESLVLVVIGGIAGAAAAMAVTRFAIAFLYDVSPQDPMIALAAAGILASVAMFASFLPARRASRVDPIVALRYE